MFINRKLFNFYKNNTFAFCLGSTWFVLINSGLVFTGKYFNNFDNRHSYIDDAVSVLRVYLNYADSASVKILKKKGNIDSSNGRAKCELLLSHNGEHIYLHVNAVKKDTGKKGYDNSDELDDEEGKDISDYIENPYLIKKEIKLLLQRLRLFVSSFISSRGDQDGGQSAQHNQAAETGADNTLQRHKEVPNKHMDMLNIIGKGNKWKINNIMMVKRKRLTDDEHKNAGKKSLLNRVNLLVNNFFHYKYEIHGVHGHPAHNSYFYKYDQKKKTFSQKQKNLGKFLFCAFVLSTVLGIKRIYIYTNSYFGLNFVKKFVLGNDELYKIMGNSPIQILSISGVHEKNYLNSKVFIQAMDKQGVVQMTATKGKTDKGFLILHAKLLLGSQTIELRKGNSHGGNVH
ncbi:conserved Plasmodium protein, unknown function [Plasmodium knowlesi strain H]|uniref:Uncharacterized protein n=3 Tax=Plasmodium knowlesi TaxID=5850 RepID=A0A5K1UDU0_PLAKH|nr:conserved Plasmodium protein, unknown function [Plasmodium knowlesi strain H]OTN66038.1 Uncharacterized protein PKNOH_S100045200 [Plasmodium knowlesi]CAA9987815.1 conserved Plasmodium protein, unknown function [Plasmodium knowlesi strain H]SBO22388.1 conserved Plasmodium protein, unknown function [Plasmodium knowlesi strain H]SBO29514.1 conserved Plasmodium protein, unknown function [Plasmodium knowlesi strain H]VVS77289.1 conserved Plasmodium protein, unknown function [Plasmodium knowlesi |eukprot:XP_002258812.1 hypothetical protein, conserved in Plasmodium species [Plasmodium knowlesi strain H]